MCSNFKFFLQLVRRKKRTEKYSSVQQSHGKGCTSCRCRLALILIEFVMECLVSHILLLLLLVACLFICSIHCVYVLSEEWDTQSDWILRNWRLYCVLIMCAKVIHTHTQTRTHSITIKIIKCKNNNQRSHQYSKSLCRWFAALESACVKDT